MATATRGESTPKVTNQKNGASALSVHRFSVKQYHQMIQAGFLGENDRVELLDGLIVAKMTHNPPHDASIQLTETEIRSRLPRDWNLRIQSAITLSKSEPEPDIAVVKGPARRYVKKHPGPRDIGLLVEVAETILDMDRHEKGSLFAQAQIPVYWIINLIDRKVEVYSRPNGGKNPSYQEKEEYGDGEKVPLILKGRRIGNIPVKDLLP